MNIANAVNERDRLSAQVAFLRNLVYGLITLGLVLSGGWFWTVMNATVAIVPPEIKRPYEVGSNFASRDYLSDVANYVLQQVLTVSPDSVDYNNKVILRMTDPDGYGKLKADLEGAALRIKRDRVTTVWVPAKETVSEKDKTVKVAGFLKTYIGDALTSNREKEFVVDFTITASGRLYVLKVQEVVKPSAAGTTARQPAS